MSEPTDNLLISSKPSESGLSVSLHPLVLLTVSDQVTRHAVRQQQGPVAGALLGQQKGREITAEYAFPVLLVKTSEGQWQFDYDWMETRIQQYKDVHKNPALEFVGWFTLCRAGGPLREFVSLQRQAINFYNDSAILLTMHPELVTSADATNGRLPISIYESALDVEQPKDDGSMQVDGEEISTLKFRQVPYTIETDETEMIAIDYVAKGAGSAAMVEDAMTEEPTTKPTEPSPQTDKKGKKRADPPTPAVSEPKSTNGVDETTKTLTPEEEDQIASITTRLNSVKMLQSRISLLRSFVQSLPPSYISDQDSSSLTDTSPDPSHLPHLRNIQALLTRLSLLTPVESATSSQHLAAASQAQSNDVALASMLSLLGQDIQALSELGRKFATVESGRGTKGKSGGGPKSGGGAGGVVGSGAGPFGGLDDSDGRFGGVTVTGTGSGMMV